MARKNMGIRKGPGEIAFEIVNYTILAVVAVSMLYPFIYVLAISLNDANDSQLGGIWLYPRVLSFESYKIIFSDPSLLQALGISVARTVIGTVLTVIGCSMFAYVFTRNEFVLYKPLKGFFFFCMFFGGGGLIPTYMLYLDLGLYNSFWVYVIPTIINLWYVTLFRTYFRSIPGELLEAARIDGAGEFQVYLRVLMPVSKPIIATITLFSAVAQWNSYRDTLYYTTDKNLRSLQYIVMEIIKKAEGSHMIDRKEMMEMFHGDASTADPVSLRMAITICTVLPIIMVYPFLQKHFMKGMMVGSMKG
ncbi:MAG: carbohydrate ABC transporter permease [Oscillospiraceae bacterium]|nr:carbohydrate ABC transporter permease [Oscillospiraceae bacterium]